MQINSKLQSLLDERWGERRRRVRDNKPDTKGPNKDK